MSYFGPDGGGRGIDHNGSPTATTAGEMTITLPRETWRIIANAAAESEDRWAAEAGLALVEQVDGPGPDDVSDRDDYEDMPSADLAEIMRAHALEHLASALEECDSVSDAAYRIDSIGRERGEDLFPGRVFVTDFVADAAKCLRAARALAKEDTP